MDAYELMIKTNHYLIKGGELTEQQKKNIASRLLSAKSTPEQVKRFHDCLKVSESSMYPLYFVPPYNGGRKLKTVLNQTPKTHILSANMYELEILRLLYILSPEDSDVEMMVSRSLSRLKNTCFGYMDDGVGECFDTSLVVLRFLAAVAPYEKDWIQSRIDNYNRHYGDKKRPSFCVWYFWLCLSELPEDIAMPEIDMYKIEMLNWLLNKSCVMNSDNDKRMHPVLLCILRNILAKYPEYAYIKDRQPCVKQTDGRLYFDMSGENENG